MINRPPDPNKIPIGAEWLNTMPQGQDWSPPNRAQPIVEINFRNAAGRNREPQNVVEYAYAEIRREHLNHGTNTNEAMRKWVQEVVGQPRDDAGHIIGNRQGGLGTEKWNIFPQSRHFNRGAYRGAEEIMYSAANASATATVRIWFCFNYDDRSPLPCRPTCFNFFAILPTAPNVPPGPGDSILHDNIHNPDNI